MSTALTLPDTMPLMEPTSRFTRIFDNHNGMLPFRILSVVVGVAGLAAAVALAVLGSVAIVPAVILGSICAVMIAGGVFNRIELMAASWIALSVFGLGISALHGYVIIPIVLG